MMYPTFSGLLKIRARFLTSKFLVIRLVYYDSATKPRIWMRSPGTSKELTNSIADFVPIHSGTNAKCWLIFNLDTTETPNTSVTNVLAQKVKEAKIFAPLNAKLKENREIMERLSRL